jgi:hypothetical protein
VSSEAREWVWEHSASKGTARLVLLSVADRVADGQCVAWASLTSLADRTRASRSTVREALDRLLACGELEQLEELTGPQRATVYRLPHAARAIAHAAQRTPGDGEAAAGGRAGEDPPLRIPALRRYGIRPRAVAESGTVRNPAGPETGTPTDRKPAPRGSGNRHFGGPETGPQNRSEPKVNRRYSSGGTARVPARAWQADATTWAWARENGHLERLGEAGLRAADAKWRAHRATWPSRPPAAWASDWRSWVAREHLPPPPRPGHHAVAGPGGAGRGGMTRAEAHTAALLAALDEPAGTE